MTMSTEISTEAYFALLLHYRDKVSFVDLMLLLDRINNSNIGVYIDLNRGTFYYAMHSLSFLFKREGDAISRNDTKKILDKKSYILKQIESVFFGIGSIKG